MKYIVKAAEPHEFISWKKGKKGKPQWNDVPKKIKDILRERIRQEQGYICCYCERSLREDDYHIEHIKPKGKSYFPLNQLDYDNLLCSCQSELGKGEPKHCGRSKDHWYHDTLFISPLDPSCEKKFKFYMDGHIGPVNEIDNSTIETIQHLNLNLDKLNAMRSGVIEPFLNLDDSLTEEELLNFVKSYLIEKENNGGKYNEFYTTIVYLFP